MLTLGPMGPEHELVNFLKLFSEFKPRAYFCINIYVLKQAFSVYKPGANCRKTPVVGNRRFETHHFERIKL